MRRPANSTGRVQGPDAIDSAGLGRRCRVCAAGATVVLLLLIPIPALAETWSGRVSGDENYALCSPFTQWTRWPGTSGPDDAGQAASGYWAMMRFNLDTEQGSAAYGGVQASGAVVDPATITPSNRCA